MCIAIVAKPSGKEISPEHFNNSWDNNADGIGIVFVENGEFRVAKTLERCDVIYQEYLYARSIGSACLIHFRKATHGEVSEQNCHPFPNGEDEFLVHNGVLSLHELPSHEVDSKAFAYRVLQHLPNNWRELPDIVKMVEKYLGGSKVAILNRAGQVTILNESDGHWDEGNWYSNRSYSYGKYTPTTKYRNPHTGYYDGYYDSYYTRYQSDWSHRQDKVTPIKPYKESVNFFDDKWSKKGTLYLPERSEFSLHNDQDDKKIETGSFELVNDEDPYKPNGFQWNGYDVCTWCLPQSMLKDDADLIPIFLGDDEDSFECISCLTTITKDDIRISCDRAMEIILAQAFDEGIDISIEETD